MAPLPESLGNKTVHLDWGRLEMFCKIVGENNPIHREKSAAQAAGFRDVIAPIVMTESFVSAFIAEKLPSAVARFLWVDAHEPVYPDDDLTILLCVTEQKDRAGMKFALLGYTVMNQLGKKVASGRAKIVLGLLAEPVQA